MVTHVSAVSGLRNLESEHFCKSTLRKNKWTQSKMLLRKKSVLPPNDNHSVNTTLYADTFYLFNPLSFLPFHRASEEHLCFPIWFELSAILLSFPFPWLYQISSQVSSSLHWITLHKWPCAKSQTESSRISSTLWPQPQIIDICFISITISLSQVQFRSSLVQSEYLHLYLGSYFLLLFMGPFPIIIPSFPVFSTCCSLPSLMVYKYVPIFQNETPSTWSLLFGHLVILGFCLI